MNAPLDISKFLNFGWQNSKLVFRDYHYNIYQQLWIEPLTTSYQNGHIKFSIYRGDGENLDIELGIEYELECHGYDIHESELKLGAVTYFSGDQLICKGAPVELTEDQRWELERQIEQQKSLKYIIKQVIDEQEQAWAEDRYEASISDI